jgi:hypothetical protein
LLREGRPSLLVAKSPEVWIDTADAGSWNSSALSGNSAV